VPSPSLCDEMGIGEVLPPLPAWLAALLASPPLPAHPADDDAVIPEGQRNDTLYRLARSLKARDLSDDAVAAAVRAENEARCSPPLPDDEVEALITSGLTGADRLDYGKEQGAPVDPAAAIAPVLRTTRLSDVEPEDVQWLWASHIPASKLALVVGDPSIGKSSMTLDLAARLTTGKPWPDGAPAVPVGDVLLLQAEDGVADTVRKRFDNAGGDATRLRLIDAVCKDGSEEWFSLESHLEHLRPLLAGGTVRLLIIDPLAAYLGKADSYKDADVRRVLAPLVKLAAETGVAVVAVMHLNKKVDFQALYRVGGSIGFMAVPRVVMLVTTDQHDPERRLLRQPKNNLAAKPGVMAFRITEQGLRWAPADDVDPNEALEGPAVAGGQRSAAKTHAAMVWLKEALKAGPVPVHQLKEQAAQLGHAWPTVERAKGSLRLELQRAPGGTWVWALPISESINTSAGDDEETTHHHRRA